MSKLQKSVTSTKGSRVLSATLTLLALTLFIVYTCKDFTYLYDSLSSADPQDDAQQVEEAISNIIQEIEVKKSSTGFEGATTTLSRQSATKPTQYQSSSISKQGSAGSWATNTADGHKNTDESLAFDPSINFKEILSTSPVVIFTKSSDLGSQYLKNLLTKEYQISPQVAVVELDKHAKGKELQDYIKLNKLTAYKSNLSPSDDIPEVPYLFINGVSIINKGLKDDIKKLHKDGSLLDKLRTFAGEKVMFEKANLPSNS